MADGNMIPLLPQSDGRLAWGNGVISMLFDVTGDSPVRLANVAGRGMAAAEGGLSGAVAVVERDARPIVEVRAANTGSQDNRLSLIATVAGGKLRFGPCQRAGRGFRRSVPFGNHPIRLLRCASADGPRIRTRCHGTGPPFRRRCPFPALRTGARHRSIANDSRQRYGCPSTRSDRNQRL